MVLTNQFYQSLSGGRSQLPSLAGILTVDTVKSSSNPSHAKYTSNDEHRATFCS